MNRFRLFWDWMWMTNPCLQCQNSVVGTGTFTQRIMNRIPRKLNDPLATFLNILQGQSPPSTGSSNVKILTRWIRVGIPDTPLLGQTNDWCISVLPHLKVESATACILCEELLNNKDMKRCSLMYKKCVLKRVRPWNLDFVPPEN
mgnify:CR=1 FL=1